MIATGEDDAAMVRSFSVYLLPYNRIQESPTVALRGGRFVMCSGGPDPLPPTTDPAATIPPAGDPAGSHPPASNPGSGYRPLRFHARGGLGEVHVALDEELNREVALKTIQAGRAQDPSLRARFLREAEVTGPLEHPGIVPVYGLVTAADGSPAYAMRFITGESLHDAILAFHAEQARRRAETVLFFRQAARNRQNADAYRLGLRPLLGHFVAVCNAVAYAHSRGVVHRDLKPQNVMLGKYGETLVLDWGLARHFARTESDRPIGEESLVPAPGTGEGLTEMGRAIGTPAYMSPEQAAGRWDVVAGLRAKPQEGKPPG
jgi:serine/threonine-protein kinase